MGISVFKAKDRSFAPYLHQSDDSSAGNARIARLIGPSNSTSMSGGVVEYEQLIVDWDLPFDEMITVIEGQMTVRSGGNDFDLGPGDVAWFPAHTPLTYDVPERVVVSYAVWPQP